MHEHPSAVPDLLAHHVGVVTPCYDERAGDGFQSALEQNVSGRRVDVAVFPDTGIVRVKTPLSELTVRRASLHVPEGMHALEIRGATAHEAVAVLVFPNGQLIFSSHPVDAEPGAAAPATAELAERVATLTPQDAEATREDRPEEEKHERLSLTGRVGTEPRFRTTKRDTLVCSFPLAVHQDDGSTQWHNVVAFGERALKLQGVLEKGQEVEVVGYVHGRETRGTDGQPKQKQELWAAAVKKPKAKE